MKLQTSNSKFQIPNSNLQPPTSNFQLPTSNLQPASMNVEPVVLTGRHVRLEPVTPDHVPGLFNVGNDPEIWRYMPYGQIDSLEKMRALIEEMGKRRANGTDMPFVAIHLESNSPAGCTRYMDIQPAHRGLEIGGTWYGTPYRRTVVNTECKYL
ncbi:MAG: GNAT family N-acetyltransferase, partial [Chloroflexota bacterium]